MSIATKWQDVKCIKCGQLLTDQRNAIVHHDIFKGGLTGKHQVCPIPEPVRANPDQVLALTLTVARILRARLAEMSPKFFNEDHAALTEALAPFDPSPGENEASMERPTLTIVKKDPA